MRVFYLSRICLLFSRCATVHCTKSPGAQYPNLSCINASRYFHTSIRLYDSKNEGRDPSDNRNEDRKGTQEKRLIVNAYFNSENKNKRTFEDMIQLFKDRNPARRGHVEFILAALKHMEEFGVAHDLETYKKLIQILPEEKFVPQNVFQVEFFHYPKQQNCIIDVLDFLEGKGICPDEDMLAILKRIFGRTGHPVRKCLRMMYWIPKFKNVSPWPVPNPAPKDPFILAKMAIERIVSVDVQSLVTVYETKSVPEALDHTYIISGQSPKQRKLLEKHPRNKSLYVEGAFRIWLRTENVFYFILRADTPKVEEELQDPDDITSFHIPFLLDKPTPKSVIEKPSVHEQDDGTILAVCATGTSSRDSLLSWIRLLEMDGNPALADIPVLFTLKSPLGDVVPMNDGPSQPRSSNPEKLGS